MSRLFFFILLMSSLQVDATTITAKQIDTVPSTPSASYYLHKANRQRNIGAAMMSVSCVFFSVGLVGGLACADASGEFYEDGSSGNKKGDAFTALTIVGGVLALASVPILHASNKNRKLAKTVASVSLKMESANRLQTGVVTKTYFPAFKISMRF